MVPRLSRSCRSPYKSIVSRALSFFEDKSLPCDYMPRVIVKLTVVPAPRIRAGAPMAIRTVKGRGMPCTQEKWDQSLVRLGLSHWTRLREEQAFTLQMQDPEVQYRATNAHSKMEVIVIGAGLGRLPPQSSSKGLFGALCSVLEAA